MKERLLFLDLMKILGILFVVIHHLNVIYKWIPNDGFLLQTSHYFVWTFGSIGVMLFLIASGAGLALNTKSITTRQEILDFYSKRVLRIYPSFWIAMVLAILIVPWVKTYTLFQYLETFSGFQYINDVTTFSAQIVPYWFIGVIIVLYLCYPVLNYLYNKYSIELVFTGTVLVSLVGRYMAYHGWNFPLVLIPLEYIIYFTLGIFLIKKDLFPHTIGTSSTIYFLADVSFYIYLVHAFTIFYLLDFTTYGVLLFICSTLLLSIGLMMADKQIQLKIKSMHA